MERLQRFVEEVQQRPRPYHVVTGAGAAAFVAALFLFGVVGWHTTGGLLFYVAVLGAALGLLKLGDHLETVERDAAGAASRRDRGVAATGATHAAPAPSGPRPRGVHAKVAAAELRLTTSAEPEAIQLAGRRAAEAARRFLDGKVVEVAIEDGRIDYEIGGGPGGVMPLMSFHVRWTEEGNGDRDLTLEVDDFATLQPTQFFIPVGPKEAPALKPLKRFAAALRAELPAPTADAPAAGAAPVATTAAATAPAAEPPTTTAPDTLPATDRDHDAGSDRAGPGRPRPAVLATGAAALVLVVAVVAFAGRGDDGPVDDPPFAPLAEPTTDPAPPPPSDTPPSGRVSDEVVEPLAGVSFHLPATGTWERLDVDGQASDEEVTYWDLDREDAITVRDHGWGSIDDVGAGYGDDLYLVERDPTMHGADRAVNTGFESSSGDGVANVLLLDVEGAIIELMWSIAFGDEGSGPSGDQIEAVLDSVVVERERYLTAHEDRHGTASQAAIDEDAHVPDDDVEHLIEAWYEANAGCRGGTDPAEVQDACDLREELSWTLRDLDWCHGRESEAAYEYEWHRCEADSYDGF